MAHHEVFHILTDRHGGSDLSWRIACATASEHYARTTLHREAPSADHHASPAAASEVDDDVCSTGLRVYAGAQVLSAFLVPFGNALLQASRAASPDAGVPHPFTAVELGCGCGLAGFTLSRVVECAHTKEAVQPSSSAIPLRVVFTDASSDCLALVRESGSLNAMNVVDATVSSSSVLASAPRMTYPLDWGPQGVSQFARDVFGHDTPRVGHVDLIIGSDLLYYRVDIVQLLDTCKRLLCLGMPATSQVGPHPASLKLVVFSHFMRIADGQRKVAEAARALGMGVVCVPFASFLDASVVLQSSFQGLELILVFLRHGGVCEARDQGEVDVASFRAMVERAVVACPEASTPECAESWQARLRALSNDVRPYGQPSIMHDTAQYAEEEENALLHMLCDL